MPNEPTYDDPRLHLRQEAHIEEFLATLADLPTWAACACLHRAMVLCMVRAGYDRDDISEALYGAAHATVATLPPAGPTPIMSTGPDGEA